MDDAVADPRIPSWTTPWRAAPQPSAAAVLGTRAEPKPQATGLYQAEGRGRGRWAGSSLRSSAVPYAYLAAITVAELVTALVDARVGAGMHVLLLMALLSHAALVAGHPYYKLLIALSLAPLVRILSLSMPLEHIRLAYWYAIIAFPVVLTSFLVGRTLGLSRRDLGLSAGFIPVQVLVALTGVGLGLLEYLILRPEPLIDSLRWQTAALPALTLLAGTGFSEELLFRGVMLSASRGALGRLTVLYVSAVFAVLHIGHRSALDVAFVLLVGLFFAWVVVRTGSILGVTLSHGVTNIALYLVVPFLGFASGAPSLAADAVPVPAGTPVAAEAAAWEPPTLVATTLERGDAGDALSVAAAPSRAIVDHASRSCTLRGPLPDSRPAAVIPRGLGPCLLGAADSPYPSNHQVAFPPRGLTMA